MRRFIALHPTEETKELIQRHPNAFLLLTQIAIRARWTPCRITGLKEGESMIGDWRKAGLPSEMAYRHAKSTLEKLRLATFRGTTRGTIASLADSTIFSVSAETNNGQNSTQATDEQRTSNGQATTNHSEHLEHFDTLNTDLPPNPQGGALALDPNPPKKPRARKATKSERTKAIAERLWPLFPGKSRNRSSMEKLESAIAKRGMTDAEAEIAAANLALWAKTEDWKREGGQYVAAACRLIAQGKHLSPPADESPPPVVHYREKPTIIDANDPELIRRMEEAEANGEIEEVPF